MPLHATPGFELSGVDFIDVASRIYPEFRYRSTEIRPAPAARFQPPASDPTGSCRRLIFAAAGAAIRSQFRLHAVEKFVMIFPKPARRTPRNGRTDEPLEIPLPMTQLNEIAIRARFPALVAFIWLCGAVVSACWGPPSPVSAAEETPWQELEPGLWYGRFFSPQASETGDSLIRVLRIDPALFEFKLLSASALKNGQPMTTAQWSRQHHLKAAINASMYQKDYRTSVSLMRSRGYVNNPRLSKDMTVLAFDRRTADVPVVKIIDRECEDFRRWKKKYRTLVQSIRMISCTGRNVWSEQPQRWSTAAIATDRRGRVLFIYVASPFSTHDLIENLKNLPLGIQRAMYAEGGLPAQLYVNAGGKEFEFAGGRKIAGGVEGEPAHPWAIPNVIGVVPIRNPHQRPTTDGG